MSTLGDGAAHAAYAKEMDENDALTRFRERFHVPLMQGKSVRYFCGNSLGLQPTSARDAIIAELDDWANLAVEGHFHARHPWVSYHRMFAEPLAKLLGAHPHEVVCMNTLTVNLHLMMTSFYRPSGRRTKIIIAGHEFPSDRYAVESQVRLHGLDPQSCVVEVQPLPGSATLSTQQIIDAIHHHADTTALVLFSGVHFYTGQRFDMEAIAKAARSVGANVGFDLAHAVGNVDLHLHDWDADFAVWCSYKYLNSSPGAIAGLFVHERHANRPDLIRLAGWWGNDESTRFAMEHGFTPTFGADGWQLSNAQILPMAVHKAALDIFMEAGLEALWRKRDALTAFLERLIDEVSQRFPQVSIITPRDPAQRGAQLSVAFAEHGRRVFEALHARGIIVDWRLPNAIRVAPVPLYNTFDDVYAFGCALHEVCCEVYV